MMLPLFGMVLGPTDAELVERFQGGDRRAFELIVQRYQHRVYSQCLRWVGDDQVAHEISQDVFLAMFRHLGRFRGDARLSTWIFRVVVNHCKNRKQYRRRRRMDAHEPLEGPRAAQDDDAPHRQLPADGPEPDASVHRSEAEQLLRDALDTLDEQQRQIVVLRDVDELSYEEIAELLDLPKGTVKSRLHRARTQLAKVLSRSVRKEDVVG